MQPQGRTRRFALTEGILAGALFGTAAILIRYLQSLDAFSIAFWRLVIAATTLLTALALLRKPLELGFIAPNMRDLLILSVFLGLHFILFVSAVKDTTILNATILVNTTPIFSIFISSYLFKLRPTRLATMGMSISFIGVGVIAYAETLTPHGNSNQTDLLASLKGDLEAVLAALVEALYLNYGRKIRSRTNVLSIMIPIYFLTAIVVGGLTAAYTQNIPRLPVNIEPILALIGLAVLPTAVAHTLYFSSLSNLKSFETATMALLEPIGATILGIGLFHEIPTSLFVVGAALVLAGILFVVRHESRDRQETKKQKV
jgi:drug/metabolite transporter (DMT)-like permease